MELHNAVKIFPKVTLQRRLGMESENAYNCPIVATFGHYIWKATPSEASKSGTPNLELELRRFCGIEQMPCPLLVIYTYGASTSNYTCHPNMHYLLHVSAM